jgi:hypothetical protein
LHSYSYAAGKLIAGLHTGLVLVLQVADIDTALASRKRLGVEARQEAALAEALLGGGSVAGASDEVDDRYEQPKETQSQVWFHCVETRFQETRIFIQHERENIGWIAGRDRHRRL